MAIAQRDVIPILDIENAEFAEQYQLGAWWARYGDEQGNGPQPDTYFIGNVTSLIKSGHFSDSPDSWFPRLGFFLGMVHGGILNPQTGKPCTSARPQTANSETNPTGGTYHCAGSGNCD